MSENPYYDRPRSWSQLSQFEQCPHAFYLSRIAKVWRRPAAWYASGLAVHSGVEAHEKGEAPTLDDMLRVAQEAFRQDVNSRLEETPNADYWQSSGPYHGPQDIKRRYDDLERHLKNYLMVTAEMPDVWLAPDGDPADPGRTAAVEYPLELNLDGVEVIGSIDQVRPSADDPDDLEIWDVKAGSMTPDEPGQLVTYAEDIRRRTGRLVVNGGYIMTAKKPTPKGRISAAQVVRKDLTTIPVEVLTARFHAADEGIKAGNWDPKPGDQCRRCDVASSCAFSSQ